MRRLLLIITTLLVPIWVSAVPTWPQPFAPLARIVIPAATVQAATTGHSYWICANGALLDAGANDISATTVTPCSYFDISSTSQTQWSLDYGAQTGNVGGKIAVAELWPTIPTPATSVQPYVRDVASHWIVTAGLGFVYQQSIPEAMSVLYDWVSAAAGALQTPITDVSDFTSLNAHLIGTGAAAPTGCLLRDYDAAGTSISSVGIVVGIAGTAKGTWAPTSGTVASGSPATPALSVPQFVSVGGTGGAASTLRIVLTGERKRPLRRPKFIAPYIQWVNPGTGGATPVVPTAATPIYLELWGG